MKKLAKFSNWCYETKITSSYKPIVTDNNFFLQSLIQENNFKINYIKKILIKFYN